MAPFLVAFEGTAADLCYDVKISVNVLNESFYVVSFQSNCATLSVTKITYCRIIFDKTAIQATNFNYLRYGSVLGSMFGGVINSINLGYINTYNFIMGIIDFNYLTTSPPFHFQFDCIVSGSTLSTLSVQPFLFLNFTYFSLKYPSCPAALPYFDPNSMLCYSYCIPGTYLHGLYLNICVCHYSCVTCLANPTSCATCFSGNNRVLNGTSCDPLPGYFDNGVPLAAPCGDANCLHCLNSTFCVLCLPGFYADTNGSCMPCTMSGCIECLSLAVCTNCSSPWLLVNSTCLFCNTSINIFYNASILNCQLCTLTGCIICSNLTVCQTCDMVNLYLFDNLTSQCSLCTQPGCLFCTSSTTCNSCDTANHYQLISANVCVLCTIPNCITCLANNICSSCSPPTILVNASCLFCDPLLNNFYNASILNC